MPSLRIDIPIDTITAPGTRPPARLAEYNASPKTPEEHAALIAARDERTKRLHELHLEHIKANAKRANDRVKEGVARKLRLEAAKVEKASAALDRAKSHVDSKNEESSAKREANKAKRAALFEAVREARKERQNERTARQIALATLEDKAYTARAKMVLATSQKGRAAVKHALAVSAALKAKERVEAAEALKVMHNKQMLAEVRRQEVYEASHTIHSSHHHKQRLYTKLNEEAAALEEKRYKYAKSMGNAIGKRAARIDYISNRAKMANAHAKEVAEEVKAYRDEILPKSRKHSLTVRMQSAEINRLTAQKTKLDTVAAVAAGLPLTPNASPTHTPQPSLPSSPEKPTTTEAASKIYYLGPDGGYGRLPPTKAPRTIATPANTIWAVGSNMMLGAVNAINTPLAKKPVLIIIPSHQPTDRRRRHAPPADLVSRLLFNPRILLATAKARHAAAAGRRTIARAYKQAQAAHYGTVRVAQAAHRRTARHELVASLLFVQEERGAQNAEAHTRAVAAKARLANHRVIAAAMRRSALRIGELNAMMVNEEKRQNATIKRTTRLLHIKANRYDKAAQVAARARLAARDASLALKAAAYLTRENEAETRRAAILDYIVSKARACGASIVPRTRRGNKQSRLDWPSPTPTSLASLPPPKVSIVFSLNDQGVPTLKIDTSALPSSEEEVVDRLHRKLDEDFVELKKRIEAQNAEVDRNDLINLPLIRSTFDEKPILGGCLGGGGDGFAPTPDLASVVEEVSMMRKALAFDIMKDNERNAQRSRKAKQAAWQRFTEACAVAEAAEKAAAEAVAAIHWGHLITATQMDALMKAASANAKKTKDVTSLRTLAFKVVKAANVKAANSLPNLRTLASKIVKAADVKAAKREQKKEKDEAAKAKARLMRLAHAAYGKAVEEAAVDAKATKLKKAEERAALAILAAEKAAAEAAAAQNAVRNLVAAEEDEEAAAADEGLVVIGRAMTVRDKENATPVEAARLAVMAAAAEEAAEWVSESGSEVEEDEWAMV